MFKYSDELDLIRGQQALIELGFHCLMFAENVRYEYKRDYYEILTLIFERGELKITNLALSQDIMDVKMNPIPEGVASDRNDESITIERIKLEKIRVA